MKITKTQLKQIVNEELSAILIKEGIFDRLFGGNKDEPGKEEISDEELNKQLTKEDTAAAEFIIGLHEDGIINAEEVLGLSIAAYNSIPTAMAMARLRISDDPAKQDLFKNLLQLAVGTRRIDPKTGYKTNTSSNKNVWVAGSPEERSGRKGEAEYIIQVRDFKFAGGDSLAPAIVDAMAKRHQKYKNDWNDAFDSRDRSKEQAAAGEAAAQRNIDQGLVKRDGSGFTDKGREHMFSKMGVNPGPRE